MINAKKKKRGAWRSSVCYKCTQPRLGDEDRGGFLEEVTAKCQSKG